MAGPAAIFTAISSVGTLLGGAGAVGGLLKKTPKPTPLPELKQPTVAPTRDDDAARRARQAEAARRTQTSGRQSTFLSDAGRETLGG